MKIYLSGAITGCPTHKKDFQIKEAFMEKIGFKVFNPLPVQADAYERFMKQNITELVRCDRIFIVNDVTTSNGSMIERMIADKCRVEKLTDKIRER